MLGLQSASVGLTWHALTLLRTALDDVMHARQDMLPMRYAAPEAKHLGKGGAHVYGVPATMQQVRPSSLSTLKRAYLAFSHAHAGAGLSA